MIIPLMPLINSLFIASKPLFLTCKVYITSKP